MNELTEQERAEGFESLFNGSDLEGWKFVGTEESWSAQDGVMVCDGEGRGWIRPDRKYANFVLRLSYRISEWGNSGVFLRTSEEGRPAFQGMEIQLLDGHPELPAVKENGAIYESIAPSSHPENPAGEWNDIELSCEGPVVRVEINGTEVVRCDTSMHPDLKDRLTTGYIGLQNHRSPIDFRDIRIRVL